MRLIRSMVFVCFVCALPAVAHAATLRVCASGCQYTGLQAAIDAAQPGDTILLRAGETFVGPFLLRKKPASTLWITIRSDASDTLLPAAGVRLVPSGKVGANTALSLLPRLVGQHGAYKTTPVIRTESGAHHYILKFLELDGVANQGFETVLCLGEDTTAPTATDIVVDRVYIHGHRYKGNKRGITLNGARLDILNSYISDIKSVNADSQALASYNGAGPFRIINNYLEGAGENILFGGSDPAVTNLVPTNIEIRRNHLFKPLAWRNPILNPPGSPRAAASTTAGALAGGTHYFRVVALMFTDNNVAVSVPSAVVSTSVTAGKSATVSWSGVTGADRYRIYRGTSSTSQSVYMETPAAATSFTYTGSGERSGTPPASGTKWVVKNIFELKNAQQVIVEGNLMENVWAAGQYGYAMVLTPRNQSGGASWVRVRDVTITNNIVRHAAGVLQISGYDAVNVSQQTQRITLRNNLFDDIDPQKWGGTAKAYLMGEGVASLVIDRNTLIHKNSSVVYAYGNRIMTGFVYTNNISLHHTYGIMGEGGRPGLYSINLFFTGWVIKNNVLAGGPAASYPTPNSFPTIAEWNASFVNLAAGDYRLLSTSPFYGAGVNGTIPGANLGAIDAALKGVASAPTSPAPAPQPAPSPSNTPPIARPGGPYSGAAGASITVDGSASSDAEGNIASYRWTWGDEILVNAADVPASWIVGSRWARVQSSGAAGGWALHNADRGEAKKTAALAAPASYVEVRFHAAAGVPYRLWFRMRAQGDSYANDSMFVQFSDSVTAQGTAENRINTTAAAVVVLEEGNAAGVAGWGWNDAHYGSLAAPVYFARSGQQVMRVQQREDGIMWDQVVVSARTYFNARPGLTRSDDTIVPASFGRGDGVVASHAYPVGGAYPLVLTVVDGQGAVGSASTMVNVGAAAQALVTARAGGPYTGSAGAAIAFDGSTSSVPGGVTAKYLWTFGDDVVLHAPAFRTIKGRWRTVSVATAASGAALENGDAGDAKISTASSAPANYVEATFRAAAGVPYRLWVRMRALNDSYSNDSVFVQFSGSVTSTGAGTARIGSTSALEVLLEEGRGAGVSGWGWADASYGGLAAPIYFNADGTQTIRIQQREDGVQIDQVVISATEHFAAAPGLPRGDSTIVPLFGPGATGAVTGHAFRTPGVYPVLLTVDGGTAGTSTSATTATVK